MVGLLIALLFILIVCVLFALSEVRMYRRGVDVFEWTITLSKWLSKYNL